MKKLMIAGFATLALSVSAHAGQCPADMSKIDAAMQTAQLSETDKTKVMELRTKGEELHESGNHAESVKILGEAKQMLGIE
ncbi:MAG: hypothetical protein HKN05_23005 [Rhizobiales bacterium]|nr:hypothetical protein [Hyphomicrobiales bacterium]